MFEQRLGGGKEYAVYGERPSIQGGGLGRLRHTSFVKLNSLTSTPNYASLKVRAFSYMAKLS